MLKYEYDYSIFKSIDKFLRYVITKNPAQAQFL